MTEDCIHYAEWDVYKTPFSHTHINKSARTPPLRSFPGLVRRIAALLSDIHLFYLGWQSCLINWILNKPKPKDIFSQLLLSPCASTQTWVRGYDFNPPLLQKRWSFFLLRRCVCIWFLCIGDFKSSVYLISIFLCLSVISIVYFLSLLVLVICSLVS